MTVEALLQQGAARHQEGRLAEAEEIYRQVLAAFPGHPRALDLLGVVAAQTGRTAEALQLLRQAVGAEPRLASAWSNLARVLRSQDQPAEALAAIRRAIELAPADVKALNQLGELLKARGESGDEDAALAAFREVVRLDPAFAKGALNLGNLLAARKEFAEAARLFERVLQLKPDFVEGFANLGNALAGLRRFPEALNCYAHVLALKPNDVPTVINRGNALTASGDYEKAVESYRAALSLSPDRAELYKNLGHALLEGERFPESIEAFQTAARLLPEDADAFGGLAWALKAEGKLDEALSAIETALALKDDHLWNHQCRGSVLTAMGRVEEAIDTIRRTAALEPENATLASSIPSSLHYSPRFDQQALCDAARKWGERFADPLRPLHRVYANDRSPDRRLRIGYLSPDFHGHPVGFNVLPLVREHDRTAWEITCYAQEPYPDAVTHEFRRLADHWRDVLGKSDEEVTELVRADGIDILVDLALHTAGNRLLVFARKPAPVQVTFAGYPGTTGVAAIDYRLTDPYLDPPELGDGCYVEKSWRLPETFWCYDPLAHAFPVNELPALEGRGVTFGCLNNFCKINPGVIALWCGVMRALPNSRLMLLTGEGSHRDHTRALFEAHGVAGERIHFERSRPRIKYLELYREIDVGLDTFPYNGHTTSLDSYWMGVPVITYCPPGATVVARAGVSQLSNLGLQELIARTPEQFEHIAVRLAGDLPRLAGLRACLRERMRGSPLIDGKRFARNVEAAYRAMWHRWCST